MAINTGNGGATYGTSAAVNKAMTANAQKLSTDAAYKQSEIDRTNAVIAERKAQGMDTSAQEKYLNINLGQSASNPTASLAGGATTGGAALAKPTTTPTPVSSPATGNGGAVYGSGDKAADTTMANNQTKLNTDAAYKQSEIQRTLAVIAERKAQGMDTSAQEKYLTANLGYGVTALPPLPTAPAPSTGGYDAAKFKQEMADLIAKQTDLQYKAQLQKLKDLRDQQLTGLTGQERLNNQGAVDASSKAAASNEIAAKRLKEQMANMGLVDSGYNLENISDLNAQRQSELGQIERQKNNNAKEIEAQRTQINNAVASGDLALLQQLQATEMDKLIQLGYTVDSREFQERQFAWSKIIDTANQTGTFNGQQTLAAQNQAFGQQLATKQANWDAAQDVWNQSGQMVNPTSNWQGLLNQLNNGSKNPLTQTAQQANLSNMWQAANQTGYISDALASAVGLPKGITTLQAQQLLLAQDSNAQGWAGLDLRAADQASSNASKQTLYTAAQITNNVQESLTEKTAGGYDPVTGATIPATTKITTDPSKRYAAYKQAIMAGQGYTETQLDGILAASGFTSKELQDFESQLAKEYGLK